MVFVVLLIPHHSTVTVTVTEAFKNKSWGMVTGTVQLDTWSQLRYMEPTNHDALSHCSMSPLTSKM